MDVMFIP